MLSDSPSKNTIRACLKRCETCQMFSGVLSCTATKTQTAERAVFGLHIRFSFVFSCQYMKRQMHERQRVHCWVSSCGAGNQNP